MSLTAEEFSYILALFKSKRAPSKNIKRNRNLESVQNASNNIETSNQAERLMDLSRSYIALTKSQDVGKNFLEPTSYDCQFCCKQFRTSSMLRQHFAQVHSDLGFKCSKCFFIATSQDHLSAHKCKLKPFQTFTCEFCEEKFRSKRDLLLHMKTHGKKHRCSKCDKEYADLGRLEKHLRQNHCNDETEGGQSFSCSTCSRKFGSKETFAYHIRYVHTQVRPFVCKLCMNSFKTYKYLKLHISLYHANGYTGRVKVGKAKAKQKVCSYKSVIDFMKMKKAENKTAPELSKEAPQLRIACPDCNKLLTSVTSFYAHKVLHKDPKVCTKCNAVFPWKWHLNKHAKNCNGSTGSSNKASSLKPYQCFLCNNSFANGAELTDHMKYHAKLDFKSNNSSSQHISSGSNNDENKDNEDDVELPAIIVEAPFKTRHDDVTNPQEQAQISESSPSLPFNIHRGSGEPTMYNRTNSSTTTDGIDLRSRLETPIDFEMFSPINLPLSDMTVVENTPTEQPTSSISNEKWNCDGAMADYVLNCSDLISSLDEKLPMNFTSGSEPVKCHTPEDQVPQLSSSAAAIQIQPEPVNVDENSVQGILNELLDTTGGPISPLTDACLPPYPATALMVDESFVLPHDML